MFSSWRFASLLLVVSSAALAQAPAAAPAEAPPPASAPPAPEPSKAVQFVQDGAAFSVHSPFDDIERTEKLAEAIGLNVVLALDYAQDPGAVQEQLGGAGQSLRAKAGYSKKGEKGGKKRLAIAVAPAGTGSGFDIYVVGRQNADLATIKDQVAAYIDTQRATKPPAGSDWLGSMVYQVNYTQTDRLLATLKALGYATIEYDGGPAENVTEKAYHAVNTNDPGALPLVVKLPDPQKTSLLDAPPVPANTPAAPAPAAGGSTPSAAVDLGGTYLHSSTAGDPVQRLLIIHDRRAPEKLQRLFNVIDEIDSPARQIVIDAQILEVTEGYTTALGLRWGVNFGKGAAGQGVGENGAFQPFTFAYDNTAAALEAATFNVRLKALETSGDANTLSNPTVLVLDGRQARIQVGKQIPLNKSFATGQVVASEPVYIPVGIVLNIKPRVNDDGRSITMQVETIVSDTREGAPPTLDNRQVQSFVRVADNTPFVIGGLMSDNITHDHNGLPLLARIPFLGLLFGDQSFHRGKREVIIVITPHVVPISDESHFSYVVPKPSDMFDSLDSKLFRSAYRVRQSDISDYRFIQDAPAVKQAMAGLLKKVDAVPTLKKQAAFEPLFKGHVPGDGVLVRRMVWEIIRKSGYGAAVESDHLQVMEDHQFDLQSPVTVESRLAALKGGNNTLGITFAAAAAAPDEPLASIGATFSAYNLEGDAWAKKLRQLNAGNGEIKTHTLLINDAKTPLGGSAMDLLRSVMVLKRVLELNPSLGTTLASFQPGVQILFPSKETLAKQVHTVDETTARLFFEVAAPFAAFHDAFKTELQALEAEIKQSSAPADAPPPEKT